MTQVQQATSDYRGYRTAGVRLTEEMIPSVGAPDAAADVLEAVHQFDKAHVVMLTEEGIMPPSDGAAILRVLREIDAAGVVEARRKAGGGIHSGEHVVIRRLGEAVGGKIHLGRSSGDLTQVSSRIVLRTHFLNLIEGINRFRGALLQTAEGHLETVMPGYTHGQSAQPTTLAHQLLGWETALARDVERAQGAYGRIDVSPAGAAILTGSSFAINRRRTAALLGFSRPMRNTFDAILQHDDELEVGAVLAVHSHNMARFADDLMLWSTGEFGMVVIPDRYCGTSSIMMQKRNPYALEHIKGVLGEAVGSLMASFLVEKGPTGLPIMERIYGMAPVRSALTDATRDLTWMADMIPAMTVKVDVMHDVAGAFWGQATDVAAALVDELGMNWRSAHQIVGILVRLAEERGVSSHDVTGDLLDEAAIEYMGTPAGLPEPALRAALDTAAFVRRRKLYGGPAATAVKECWAEYSDQLERDREWAANRREDQDKAAAALEAAIDGVLHLDAGGNGDGAR